MIKICNDRGVFPNSVKISNQYENDTRSIDFDLSDVQFTGNTYLICKYQNEDEYYTPLLLDSNNSVPVKTFLSQKAGMYECLIIISNVKIDENYDFSNDNPLFVSNLFNIYISKNYLNGTAKQWELSPEMKNYYDRLIALVGKVQEDLDSGAFVGNGIKNITKTGSVGLVDTYQILFTDNSTFDFQVTNGATPVITIKDGIWYINGVSTGQEAQGEQGPKGDKGDKGDPGATDAEGVSYGDSNVKDTLDKMLKDLGDIMYEPINIVSFTVDKSTNEMGSTVNKVVLNWNYNKTPKTLTLDNETLDVSLKTKTLTGQSIKSNKTFTLKATDERDAVSTKTTAITFLNGVYCGVGDDLQISGITNQFILGLTKTLQSSKAKTFTVNAGVGKHIYYIIPSRYGTPVFKVGGFEGGFEKLGTVNFTNSSSYAENYDVYKSSNAGLGNTTVVVS